MSSKLEDALIFVRPTSDCVQRIVALPDKQIGCHFSRALHVLDCTTGDEVTHHKIPEDFAVFPDGYNVLFPSYEGGAPSLKSLNLETGEQKGFQHRNKLATRIKMFNHRQNMAAVVSFSSPGQKAKVELVNMDRESVAQTSRWFSVFEIRSAFTGQEKPTEVYVATDDRILYSVSPRSGKINWKVCVPQRIDAGDQSGKVLVVGSKAGDYARAYKLDREEGKIIPRVSWTNDEIGQAIAVSIIGDTALVGTENSGGRLYGFDLQTGEEKFRHDMTPDFGIWSMMHDDKTLYLGTGIGGKGRIYALDCATLGLKEE
jgi:hypothetical protein